MSIHFRLQSHTFDCIACHATQMLCLYARSSVRLFMEMSRRLGRGQWIELYISLIATTQ
jgi:hypothetical protein